MHRRPSRCSRSSRRRRPGGRRTPCRRPRSRRTRSRPTTARATARVPAAKGSFSKTPMGPFHTMVRAALRASANRSIVAGPMSSPICAAGISRMPTARPGRAVEARRPPPRPRAARSACPDGAPTRGPGGPSRLARPPPSDRPTSCPRARRNVYAMPPPTRSASTRARRFSTSMSLSDTLAPPSNGHQGPRRRLEDAAQRVQLGLHEQTGRRRLEMAGDGGDRGVGAVGRGKGVVDVALAQGGQLPGEARRRWPPPRHGSGGSRGGGSRRARGPEPCAATSAPTQSGARGTGRPSSAASRSATGLSEYLGSGLPLGARGERRAPRSPALRGCGGWSAPPRPAGCRRPPRPRSTGAFRSARRNTRRPATSSSRRLSLGKAQSDLPM